MFNLLIRLTVLCILLIMPRIALSAIVEAEGMAIIHNNDISSAREAAIRDASQQASMQAAVYVSSSQIVRDGILQIDNMQISTLGKVSNIEIVDEKVIGNRLQIRIRADVLVDQGCENGVTNQYSKSIAFTAFPVTNLRQLSLGGLQNISSDFSASLSQHAQKESGIVAHNISKLNISLTSPASLPDQLDERAINAVTSQLNGSTPNYIVSGIINDVSMIDPRTHAEDNYFIDLYNRLDYKSKKHLRNFDISFFVYDGYSGNLVAQKQYQTAGLWNLDPTIKTGFNTAGFRKQDYGQKVNKLEKQIIENLSTDLHCEPFTAQITRTLDKQLWINSGKRHGIKRGDKMTVYRKSTFFGNDMRATTDLINTQQTLIIEDVQMNTASGRLTSAAESFNIRPGDLAIAR